jgi:hypothetical protein
MPKLEGRTSRVRRYRPDQLLIGYFLADVGRHRVCCCCGSAFEDGFGASVVVQESDIRQTVGFACRSCTELIWKVAGPDA